jgi:hypothetical protein
MDFTSCNYNYSLYNFTTHKQESCLELLDPSELCRQLRWTVLNWTVLSCRKLFVNCRKLSWSWLLLLYCNLEADRILITISNNSSDTASIRCHGNVVTEPLNSNGYSASIRCRGCVCQPRGGPLSSNEHPRWLSYSSFLGGTPQYFNIFMDFYCIIWLFERWARELRFHFI